MVDPKPATAVSIDAAAPGAGVSRRQAMNMMTAIAAVPAVGFSSMATAATQPDRGAWNAALAKYQRVDATYTKLCDAHDTAEEAAGEAFPRVGRFFDEYRLGMGMKRDDVEFWLRSYVTRTGNKIDIAATADEFDAYQREDAAVDKRFRVKELWAGCCRYRPIYFKARDDLMAVPAPDQAALLVKIEIAATSLQDDHGEAALADARRLLHAGRA